MIIFLAISLNMCFGCSNLIKTVLEYPLQYVLIEKKENYFSINDSKDPGKKLGAPRANSPHRVRNFALNGTQGEV